MMDPLITFVTTNVCCPSEKAAAAIDETNSSAADPVITKLEQDSFVFDQLVRKPSDLTKSHRR